MSWVYYLKTFGHLNFYENVPNFVKAGSKIDTRHLKFAKAAKSGHTDWTST